MLRYPASVPAQQALLAPLDALINTIPAFEQWISFAARVDLVFSSLSPGSLQNLAQMALAIAKVADYVYSQSAQSVYSSQYLLNLSVASRQLAQNALLAAPLTAGTVSIRMSQTAQTALLALSAWDAVQGYAAPPNPGAVATLLTGGISL